MQVLQERGREVPATNVSAWYSCSAGHPWDLRWALQAVGAVTALPHGAARSSSPPPPLHCDPASRHFLPRRPCSNLPVGDGTSRIRSVKARSVIVDMEIGVIHDMLKVGPPRRATLWGRACTGKRPFLGPTQASLPRRGPLLGGAGPRRQGPAGVRGVQACSWHGVSCQRRRSATPHEARVLVQRAPPTPSARSAGAEAGYSRPIGAVTSPPLPEVLHHAMPHCRCRAPLGRCWMPRR